jgi:tripartite-type tricarboxylate transporter receptor subunit TctC
LASPEIQKQLERQGVTASPSTPEDFRKLIADDIKRWQDVITVAGIKLQ